MALTKKTKYVLYTTALVAMSLGTVLSVPAVSSRNPHIEIPAPYKSALGYFAPLVTNNTSVPQNVLKALYVPSYCTLNAQINYDRGSGTFDRAIVLSTTYTQRQINNFFIATLRHFGWSIIQATKTNGELQIFANIAGSDGHYWEVGIKSPFNVNSASGQVVFSNSSKARGTRNVQLRILQMSFQ